MDGSLYPTSEVKPRSSTGGDAMVTVASRLTRLMLQMSISMRGLILTQSLNLARVVLYPRNQINVIDLELSLRSVSR